MGKIEGRMEKMEERMERMEKGLEKILDMLERGRMGEGHTHVKEEEELQDNEFRVSHR